MAPFHEWGSQPKQAIAERIAELVGWARRPVRTVPRRARRAALRRGGRHGAAARPARPAARGSWRAAVVTQAAIGFAVDPGVEQRASRSATARRPRPWPPSRTLCRQWSRWGLTRADVVVAVGGGVVTDVAGFAAAVYHRGVAVVHVPPPCSAWSTPPSAARPGVNLPEGKNLVGAFWQPAG